MRSINNTIAGLELAQIGGPPNCAHGFLRYLPTAGVATEIMGITPEGWIAIEQMTKAR